MALGDDGTDDDPSAGLRFDEEFIGSASVREASAAERLARMQRVDQQHRALDEQRQAELRALQAVDRGGRRRRWVRFPVVVLSLTAAATVGLMLKGDGSAGLVWSADDGTTVFVIDGAVADLPAPSEDQQAAPVGEAPEPPTTAEPFEFMAMQANGDQPVAYDPCQPIHVVVNPRAAPPDGDALLGEAVEEITRRTGLAFVMEGWTAESPGEDRPPYQPDRYGDRWAPVLVAWSDPQQTPELAGGVAGEAGSAAFTSGPGQSVYVSGMVVLDGPQLGEALNESDGHAVARSIVMHELAHLVGLGHVNDPTQLMNPSSVDGVTAFATGDRAGLARLGQGACFPEI